MPQKRRTGRDRQEVMRRMVMRSGEVDASDVAARLDVSLATVRRDLAALERRGLVDRTWGGARVRSPIHYMADFAETAEREAASKRRIAACAAALAEPGMVVGLSGGTTCTELARWLRGSPITVVTNAVNVATELYNHGRTKVILTGGALNDYSYELVGEMTAYALTEYRLDVCFVGSSGITVDFGFSMRDHPEAAVARKFTAVSERTFVVADHTKVGRRTLARFAPIDGVTAFISDPGLRPEQILELEAAGLHVVVAPPTLTEGEEILE